MGVSFTEIIQKKAKEWNGEHMMEDAITRSSDKLPFSSPELNYSTYGGIPRDRITEFFGDPGGGKSTTAVDICKNAIEIFKKEHEEQIADLQSKLSSGSKQVQAELADLQDRGPKKVLYIDLEHSFDAHWASILGINRAEINIMQPPDVKAEDLLQAVQELVETNEVGLVVLDSIPSLTTGAELEKKYGERTVASLAGLMTVFMRKITPMLARYHTTLLLINQVRDNMDNPYVINTPGGKAIKFYASLRILFRIGTPVDVFGNDLPAGAENPAGYKVTARIMKQKSAPWDRRNGAYYLMCQSGIRDDIGVAKVAIGMNLIIKSGAWYRFADPRTGALLEENGLPIKVQGMKSVLEFLQTNQDYYNLLKDYILSDYKDKDSAAVDGGGDDGISN